MSFISSKYLSLGLSIGVALVLGASWSVGRYGDWGELSGERVLAGLKVPATVAVDAFGIPEIHAERGEDAMRVLGYLHARDRLFQMDLMRRKSAGRLAEIFGEVAADRDQSQRVYGFEALARHIVAGLPESQRRRLWAYASGVNAWMTEPHLPPPEFLALRYSPEPWRPEDSLLVALGMFQTLNGQEQDERMLTVMDQALPAELVAFLTPDSGDYMLPLLGGNESRRPIRSLPVSEWAALVDETSGMARAEVGAVDTEAVIPGSNNWAVAGSRTRDGRAIVANDMHLTLGVPNIWYRAALHFDGHTLIGLTLPGLPMLVAGSNGHVAWGFTNIDADLLDLVSLQLDPDDRRRYRTPSGWRFFDTRRERIVVRGGQERVVEIQATIFGPVAPLALLGRPVAIRWTALDPAAVDLGLTELEGAKTLEQAIELFNASGGPPQNVVIADAGGRIAWTYMGRFPLRRGFDGSVSRDWSDGKTGWSGFIPGPELPRLIDPTSGFIVTANHRTLGKGYPHVIGHNYSHPYRAFRIAERLKALDKASEADLLDVQLDTRSEPFDFYRDLALEVLDDGVLDDPLLREARRAIEAWNGRMNADSEGIALLVDYRKKLAETVFAPVVTHCRRLDPSFQYAWREMDTPLKMLVRSRDPRVLPDRRFGDWKQLLRQVLRDSAAELQQRYPDVPLARLRWGEVNRLTIRHPLSSKLPAPLAAWLDMTPFDSPGCRNFCVRISSDPHGATERMVVAPNHPEDGILHMPGGQSGHLLSSHYEDQQNAWRDGAPLPFLPGRPRSFLRLIPESLAE